MSDNGYKSKHKDRLIEIQVQGVTQEIDEIFIENNPITGFIYKAQIKKNGIVHYYDSEKCADGALIYIGAERAGQLIKNATERFFFNDEDRGQACIDGYHWQIDFRHCDMAVETQDGWPGEVKRRNGLIKEVLKVVEDYIQKDMGESYMGS